MRGPQTPRNKICDIRKSMRKIEERETGISKFCRFVEEEKCLVSLRPCMTLIYGCTSVSKYTVSFLSRSRMWQSSYRAFLTISYGTTRTFLRKVYSIFNLICWNCYRQQAKCIFELLFFRKSFNIIDRFIISRAFFLCFLVTITYIFRVSLCLYSFNV